VQPATFDSTGHNWGVNVMQEIIALSRKREDENLKEE
jgi:hypothetical protein